MSFKQNDNNQMIHLGNYEEYFVLYMDNELSEGQVRMVDDFLLAHPDLQAELHMLMSTRLPAESLTFNKDSLFAGSMKMSAVDEDLFLYIDGELDNGKAQVVALELAANPDYALQHRTLLQAKLDPAETIVFPNKESLYRRTGSTIAFRPWMRIAAAAILIAALGTLYFNSGSSTQDAPPSLANAAPAKQLPGSQPSRGQLATIPVTGTAQKSETAGNNNRQGAMAKNQKDAGRPLTQPDSRNTIQAPEERTAHNNLPEEVQAADLHKSNAAEASVISASVAQMESPGKEFLNNLPVTSAVEERKTDMETLPDNSDVASRGSLKGFLRKATRMIEKKTGIDPTNDNGELLIGAVSLKLK